MNPIILTLNQDRGGCFNPGIVLPKRVTIPDTDPHCMDPMWEYKAILAHETTHFSRQMPIPLIWTTRYACSKSFRFNEECLAMEKEAATELKYRGWVDWPEYKIWLLTEYWDCCSEQQVDDWIKNTKAKL